MLSLFFPLLLFVRCISFWWCTFPRFFPFLFPLEAVKHRLNFIQDYKRYFCLSSLTSSVSQSQTLTVIDRQLKKRSYTPGRRSYWQSKFNSFWQRQRILLLSLFSSFIAWLGESYSMLPTLPTLPLLKSFSSQSSLWKCIEGVNVCLRSRNHWQIKKILDDFCRLWGQIMMRLLKYA